MHGKCSTIPRTKKKMSHEIVLQAFRKIFANHQDPNIEKKKAESCFFPRIRNGPVGNENAMKTNWVAFKKER